jgi:4-amino-4-deoxy-L-arabinose transferase-like glycosyltransferase
VNFTIPKLTCAPLLALGSLIVVFLVIGGIEAYRDGPTYDEPVYISPGLAAAENGDVTINAEHPPLFKVLAALPVLTESPSEPTAAQRRHAVLLSRGASPQTAESRLGQGDEYAYADALTRNLVQAHKLRSVLFAARLVPLLLCAGLGLALYWLAAALWGRGAGILAASLWLVSPLVLGFGHLDAVDVPFSLATVLFARALLAWLRSPGRASRLWLLGVAGGICALANVDGLALAALGVASVLMRSRNLGRALAVAVAAWLTIWVPYVLLNPGALSPALLPGPYVAGIRYLRVHDGGTQSYLLGMAWSGYRWWYLPLSLIVKLAPGTLIVLLAATPCWLWSGRHQRDALVAIGAPVVVLGIFELTISRDIGVRYALPLLTLWCAGAGALVPAIRGID